MQEPLIVHGKPKDLGGFTVSRSLPTLQKRSVGPFVFLDHMGPLALENNRALDVRPHPHIGLATVTYLFSGRCLHRDSIGSEQIIEPGDLNWMTAGRGIVHSEHTPDSDRNSHKILHGVQIWVGLPQSEEECAPHFVHWPKESFPVIKSERLTTRVLLGNYQEHASPAKTLSPTLFLDINADRDGTETLSFKVPELGLFVVKGEAMINGEKLLVSDLMVITDPNLVTLQVTAGSRLIAIGGAPFPEPRYLWWNFVSSRKDRLRQAAEDWHNQRMGVVPGGEDTIPLPEIPLPK